MTCGLKTLSKYKKIQFYFSYCEETNFSYPKIFKCWCQQEKRDFSIFQITLMPLVSLFQLIFLWLEI